MSAQIELEEAVSARNHGLRAVTRALFALCENREIGVLELARRVGVSVGMAQRVTAVLLESGLARQSAETRKYALGHAVLRLGNAYSQNGPPELQRCINELSKLVQQTGETAAVHMRVGPHRLVVAQLEGNHDLSWRADTARAYPLHAGAASKALLALMPAVELEGILAGMVFERFQPLTPASRAELDEHLARVRSDGVAISFGERVPGAGGVAAPVLDAGGHSRYALSVYGPEARIRPVVGELCEIVRRAAARASQPTIERR